MKKKKITILHSNDMHGDFLAEARGAEGKLTGGLALLSGYINRVRTEEKNVVYAVSGDMVQGSIIDSEYRGCSTIEIMNYLAPDVVSLGNHEFDYGLPHLLFLEKLANFPIINANLYIKQYHKRLMKPFHIIRVDGFDVLFIGIITEKIMADIAKDEQISSFITLAEASAEVGRICNSYKNDDIDLTVLLTHIGYESDLELAELLNPDWGVDLIIGGHSHTVLERPTQINGVLVAQAGVGTDQVGRFDLVVDDDTNRIVEFNWQLVPITEETAEPDLELQQYIDSFKQAVDRKYNTIVTRLSEKVTHPSRLVETSLGNLTADAIADSSGLDVVFVGSGFIRCQELGPLVTLGAFLACYGYDEALTRFTVTGSQLKRIFSHIMRPENRNGEGECYQVNRGVIAVYNDEEQRLESLAVHNKPVDDCQHYNIGLTDYHLRNSEAFLDISFEELSALSKPRVVATSIRDVLEEYLRNNQNVTRRVEGRLVYR
ncbi:MAG: bifunctional metallophosphatase/5'-nucleotidase [Chloroflexota bacterium]|jgi:5'-nucleotidase/UDP-sugar diphosphatase